YFFFQAEDGIRDWSVTGVQTCALPISIEVIELEQEVTCEPATINRDIQGPAEIIGIDCKAVISEQLVGAADCLHSFDDRVHVFNTIGRRVLDNPVRGKLVVELCEKVMDTDMTKLIEVAEQWWHPIRRRKAH